ncbi:hypothetical protein [Verminephrobacter aporrectodeae]|uniref:hypothetical protein n=1 Tax=Verminephrobacter aporrectodeae TaxID=1110389 RepID=UPI00145EA0CA|nr:hypothetical protein [Verminephrobacter aporrectodeae]
MRTEAVPGSNVMDLQPRHEAAISCGLNSDEGYGHTGVDKLLFHLSLQYCIPVSLADA